jgi:iterative type I PKS product template protein
MALTLGDYVRRQANSGQLTKGVSCGDMEVFKPLIIRENDAENRVLQVSMEIDLHRDEAKVRYQSIDNTSRQATLHATCVVTFENTTSWTNGWNNITYLIQGRMETLNERLKKNQADKMSRTLLYRLFSSFVDYKPPYQGMEEVIIDGTNFEATSRVVFQTESKDGSFFCNPYWIDSLMHLAGFVLNGGGGVDTKQFVYVSHGWKALRFAVPLQHDKTYHSYVKMQGTGENNIMAGDVYVFDNKTIVAMCVGLKFQRIPRTVLNSFLPPQPSLVGAAEQPRLGKILEKSASFPTKKPLSGPAVAKVRSDLLKPIASTATLVLDVISVESELPLSELHDDCTFANLGIDSLLSLQILGRLRETLDLDLPSNIFVDCKTIGELRRYLDDTKSGDIASSNSTSTGSVSTAATSPATLAVDEELALTAASTGLSISVQASLQMVKENISGTKLLKLFRETISEQMDIGIEEVIGSNDLLSLGMDSLMSICILGIIRERTELDLPSDFFQNYSSMDDIEKFLDSVPAKKPKQTKEAIPSGLPRAQHESPRPVQLLPRAVSTLIQGRPRTASKVIFLIPDGSGSATSYASIPAIGPSVAVYGLNSPFIKTPSLFTNGIPGIASQYLEEVRRRQPEGPYHLGGWSAGGVVAYEMMLQLMAAGERIESLLLLDSPCPIALEPLPSRLHHFFAEIGLIGSGEGTKVPDWLLEHFEASIKALSAYNPQPIPDMYKDRTPRTLAVWARYGVCRYPDSPRPEVKGDEPRSMNWLLNNRTDFGPNGWDALLKGGDIQTMTMEGNHFTLMKEKDEVGDYPKLIRRRLTDDLQLKELASAIGAFL